LLDRDSMLGGLVFNGHLSRETLAHEREKTLDVIGFA